MLECLWLQLIETPSVPGKMLPREIQSEWRLWSSPLGLSWKRYMETSERSFSVPPNHRNTLILGYMHNTGMIGLELFATPTMSCESAAFLFPLTQSVAPDLLT